MRYADLYAKMEKHSAKRLNVVNPYSDSIYEALKSAVERDWVIPVLFGEEKKIREKVKLFDIENIEIVSADSPENAAEMAVKDISNGSGHLLMKGDIPTALFMKPVLNKEWGLRKGGVLSHIAVADGDFYHKLIFIADGGININLDLKIRKAITENTVELAERILNNPVQIGFAAAIEEVNDKLPETGDAKELERIYRERGYKCDGPVAFDVMFSKKAAEKKGLKSQISENVDVIIAPNMTTANFMIKQMIFFNNANVGGIIAGAKVPLVLLSRSDSAESKLNSIFLGLM